MGHGTAYDESLAAFDKAHPGAPAMDRYEHLAIEDIRTAADTLRPVYDRLDGKDGYVSLEVSPYLANDTDATLAEAAKLWSAVDRPNLMIKIPGTAAGVPAIAATIDAGINVNVTLLFAIEAYQQVAEAYVAGLEKRAARGEPIDRIASVASFFVSRIDAKIDKAIDGGTGGDEAKALKGKVAIANAKLAYAWYQEFVASDRWQALAAKGAMPQRLLWASTGTKNPDYPPTLYLDTLIGPDTVNNRPAQDARRLSGERHCRRNVDGRCRGRAQGDRGHRSPRPRPEGVSPTRWSRRRSLPSPRASTTCSAQSPPSIPPTPEPLPRSPLARPGSARSPEMMTT